MYFFLFEVGGQPLDEVSHFAYAHSFIIINVTGSINFEEGNVLALEFSNQFKEAFVFKRVIQKRPIEGLMPLTRTAIGL